MRGPRRVCPHALHANSFLSDEASFAGVSPEVKNRLQPTRAFGDFHLKDAPDRPRLRHVCCWSCRKKDFLPRSGFDISFFSPASFLEAPCGAWSIPAPTAQEEQFASLPSGASQQRLVVHSLRLIDAIVLLEAEVSNM